MITARSDVVGSLLRPASLLRARDDYAAGRLTPAEFKRIEDAAVDEAIQLQEEAGLAQRGLASSSGCGSRTGLSTGSITACVAITMPGRRRAVPRP